MTKPKKTQHEFIIFILTLLQYLAPKKIITWLGRKLANSEIVWLKSFLINFVAKRFNIVLDEYVKTNFDEYKTFQEFFTREIDLKNRPLDDSGLVSPSDGYVATFGNIEKNMMLQAKGRSYSVEDFLDSTELATKFENGSYINIYLAPHNYHRVHAPADCELINIIYLPGELFSVNQFAAENITNLFAVNERAVFLFKSKELGEFAVVMVAATMVSGIYNKFTGMLGQNFKMNIDNTISKKLKKGEEFAQFHYGSTVIMLFANNKVNLKDFKANDSLKIGESLGQIIKK